MRASFVEANGNVSALARDADDASGRSTSGDSAGWAATAARRGCAPSLRLAAARGPLRAPRCAGGLLRLRDRHEIIVRDRILVLLPQKLLLDEYIESWRIRVGEFPLKKSDRTGDLLAAKDQFCLFFALGCLLPHRHRDRHHHGHDRQADDERRHRVASLRGAPIRFALTR
jgi:hypothetical protein